MTLNERNPTVWFLESDPPLSLLRRGATEFIGTLLLVLVIIAGQLNASPATALAAGGVLTGLILALGELPGGHFNPLITILQWRAHLRSGLCACVYVVAQVAGGTGGAILASVAFGQMSKASAPRAQESGWFLAELFFTMGLMIIVFGCMRSARKEFGALAVGVWLTGSSIGMPNTFGNPALVVGAKAALGIALTWQTVSLLLLIELGGAALAGAVIAFLFQAGASVLRVPHYLQRTRPTTAPNVPPSYNLEYTGAAAITTKGATGPHS